GGGGGVGDGGGGAGWEGKGAAGAHGVLSPLSDPHRGSLKRSTRSGRGRAVGGSRLSAVRGSCRLAREGGDMELAQRVAIVTGGGRAIGKAGALRLARFGADVVVASPDKEEIGTTAAEIQVLGRRALAVVTDVTQEDQVRNLAEHARQALGRIDILVNNAGIIGPTAPVAEVRRADW